MTVQASYAERMTNAVKGMIQGSDFNSVTGICETAAGLAFGIAVSQGTADKGVIIGGTRLGFVGVTIRDITLDVANADKYPRYSNVGIMTRGQMWVAPAVAVAPNEPVHFVTGTGVFTNTGSEGPVNGARWASSAAGTGDLALIELSGYHRSA